jgi:monoamine oxidase
MNNEHTDVAVIGAGMAGLAAARALSQAGLSVRIVEARNRVGGRAWTLHDRAAPLPIELGAEFIHGLPPETWRIVQAHNLPAYEIMGDACWSHDGALSSGGEWWAQSDTLLERMDRWNGDDLSFQSFLEAHCRDLPREAWAGAIQYVEGFNAAVSERISIRALFAERRAGDAIAGDRAFRILAGYDAVAAAIEASFDARRVSLHLNTPVTQISWRPGAVEVSAQPTAGLPAVFAAARALIALPLGVLQAPPGTPGTVRFSPELAEKRAALEYLEMGHAFKITLRFRRPFWEHDHHLDGSAGDDLSSLSFLLSGRGPFPTWWSAYPLRAPVLIGWAAGTVADPLLGRNEAAVLDLALGSLAEHLGAPREQLAALLDGWYFHDWSADPFARGAYSFVRVGGFGAQAELAQPLADTLFFAGEATATGQTGTVHGALASGERAAQEIISSLQRNRI